MKETLDRLVANGRKELVSSYVQIYKTVATSGGFLYYSCPISTGSELIARTLEGKEFSIKEIIDKNCEKANACVADLRYTTYTPIICPATIHMSGWSQEDYCLFWRMVIEQFVTTAYFGNEWAYSRGCCYEYLVCLANDIPRICNIKKKAISTEEAKERIKKTIQEYGVANLDTKWHEAVYDEIEEYERSH